MEIPLLTGLTLIQSLVRPFKTYAESGAFITRPSPLSAITWSILCLTSLADLALNSVVNSIRPWISLTYCRMFRLRKATLRSSKQVSFRYRRSNTLTDFKLLEGCFVGNGEDEQQGRGLCSLFDLSTIVISTRYYNAKSIYTNRVLRS